MKALKFVAAAAIVAATVFSCSTDKSGSKATAQGDSTAVQKQEPVSTKDLLPRKGEIDSVSYLLGINFGSFLKGYDFGEKLNYRLMKKGMLDFLRAEGEPSDSNFTKQFKINPEEMTDLFNNFLMKRREYKAETNAQKEASYLAGVEKADTLTKTASGLYYKIVNPGSGEKIGLKDTLFIHYVGTRPDGTVFDEVDPDRASRRFFLNRVIPGWKEGLQLVGDGGEIVLVIPSKLAYGENGTQAIEPNTPLHFDVKIDSVKRYVAPVKDEDNKKK